MKKHTIPILAILMALIIVNTGFVRADMLLCQTKCDYSALNEIDTPPCCKSKKASAIAVALAENEGALPSDCPHVGSNQEISDTLTFISASTKLPEPPNGAVFTAILISPWIELPDSRTPGHYSRSGLSPPIRKSPPPYRLYCSLLI
ncbi:MAG: hypothetical protein OEM01_08295 [Desulfobulbaceae bacterium]|nr:hypothetical protein [Desulfobulbaceae bacterium]